MPQRNILLLEEYDALAVAISSALKKFAPQHFGAVARSLAEAEKWLPISIPSFSFSMSIHLGRA